MSEYLRTVALVLVAVMLSFLLKNEKGGIGLLLAIAVCCMVITMAVQYIGQIGSFARNLQRLISLDAPFLQTLFKAVAVAVTSEVACLICQDAGNAAMGKSLQLLSCVVILWLSLPMLSALLELVEGIMGSL